MVKNRHWLSLGTVVIVCTAGLLVGRSQAQPEKGQQADPQSSTGFTASPPR
jgi:hypothetical protein